MYQGELGRVQSPDFFLANPPRQPKKEIGDYVESQGILVPRRFASLKEALSSKKPFIIRSEHSQDYAGASDILSSHIIDQDMMNIVKSGDVTGDIDWEKLDKGKRLEILQQIMQGVIRVTQEEFEENLKRMDERRIYRYSTFMNIPPQQFRDEISYSYWELLGVHNRVVIADNAVQGRYHIVTPGFKSGPEVDDYTAGYSIVENGNLIVGGNEWKFPTNLITDIPSLISFYEKVRGLSRFDKYHCPILEVQTVGNDHYFLQYHRTLDSDFSTFTLDRQPTDDEMTAVFVRGATPKEGVNLKVHVHSAEAPYSKDPHKVQEEEAGIDFNVDRLHHLLIARKRRMNIVRADSIGRLRLLASTHHLALSQLFKPSISIALSRKDINSLLHGFYGSQEEPIIEFDVFVISDGRKAYIKRLD